MYGGVGGEVSNGLPYPMSERAGQRVLSWMRKYLEGQLKLKVNEAKSSVDRPENRKFLGFTFERGKRKVKLKTWMTIRQLIILLKHPVVSKSSDCMRVVKSL